MDEKDLENSGQNQLIKKIKELVDYQEEDKYSWFDKVSTDDASPEKIYNEAVKPIIKDFLKGHDGAVISLGQTSVKNRVLEGGKEDPEKYGIIPRVADELFEHMYSAEDDIEFYVKVSYFEVYREKIRDLLAGYKRELSISEDKNRMPFVGNATERYASSKEELLEIIDEGKSNRDFIVTNDYEHIFLSHSILLIHLKKNHSASENFILRSKLYIVDLAGSEKLNKSSMAMLEETKHIKKSLSAFLHVITSLGSGAKSYIPYRDTKITRILQNCFSGNSKISFISCFPAGSFDKVNSEPSRRVRKIDVADTEELIMLKKRLKSEKERNSQLRSHLSEAEEKLHKIEVEKAKSEEREIVQRLKEVNLLVAKPCKDCELSRQEMHRVKQESESAKEEMREVLKLVEDLTNNYQVKSAELDKKSEEYWKLMEEHRNLLSGVKKERIQSDMMREETNSSSKQKDSMATLLKDLGELDTADDSELITLHRKDYESLKQDRNKLQEEMNKVRLENESAKNEVREVLQALEELAVNYDNKCQEMDRKYYEFEEMSEALSQKQSSLNITINDLEQLECKTKLQKKRITESLEKLLNALGEMGVVLGEKALETKEIEEISGRVEEQLVSVRIYVSRLKSAAKSLTFRCEGLENSQKESNEKAEALQKTVSDSQLQIKVHEMKVKSLNETIRDIEDKKIRLAEEVDSLTEECAKLKLTNKSLEIKEKGRSSGENIEKTLEEFFEKYKDAHQKQLVQLRKEVAEKSSEIDKLKDVNHKLSLVHEQLQLDYDKLKEVESDKSLKLQELTLMNERREQVRQDLMGLEETVSKELQILHNSRKHFVQNLQSRIEKLVDGERDDELCSSEAQKQKITFLEDNLDQLTKVHKQLVRDNAGLRCELSKLEKRLQATLERTKVLEQALKEAKEVAIRDRKRYQHELDRIREVVRKKILVRRGQVADIAKLLRPDQAETGNNNQSVEPNENSESNKNDAGV